MKYQFYDRQEELNIEFDDETGEIEICWEDFPCVYKDYKHPNITLGRITNTYTKYSTERFVERLIGQFYNWAHSNEEDEDDKELQLFAFVLLYRQHGSALVF
jgi:hypothetical protein